MPQLVASSVNTLGCMLDRSGRIGVGIWAVGGWCAKDRVWTCAQRAQKNANCTQFRTAAAWCTDLFGAPFRVQLPDGLVEHQRALWSVLAIDKDGVGPEQLGGCQRSAFKAPPERDEQIGVGSTRHEPHPEAIPGGTQRD